MNAGWTDIVIIIQMIMEFILNDTVLYQKIIFLVIILASVCSIFSLHRTHECRMDRHSYNESIDCGIYSK